MRRRWLMAHIVLSAIGVLFGISAFIWFFASLKDEHGNRNVTAGTWALVSALFAGLCMHLFYLVYRGRLEVYYTLESLNDLAGLGVVVGTISTAFFVWYIFSTAYWTIPILPVSTSSVISAVWVFMTGKWSFSLWWASRGYRLKLQLSLPLLTESEPSLS